VTEIFLSLQGEGRFTGAPTTFVRLTGCPLRCRYCDTAYAFHGGEWTAFETIFDTVRANDVRHVCVTGGEPLAQPNTNPLLRTLCDRGYDVSLETSGALDISGVDPRVSRVLDIKTPGSGESARNLRANLDVLTPRDQLKFVLTGEQDYAWAKRQVEGALAGQCAGCEIWFSPAHGELAPDELAAWILRDRLAVRMQIQLHKYLWGDVPGR
jgi:7-carboxy-7-deazaguanine synthase